MRKEEIGKKREVQLHEGNMGSQGLEVECMVIFMTNYRVGMFY